MDTDVTIGEYLRNIENELKTVKRVSDKVVHFSIYGTNEKTYIRLFFMDGNFPKNISSDLDSILVKHGFYLVPQTKTYYSYIKDIADILNEIRVKGLKDLME